MVAESEDRIVGCASSMIVMGTTGPNRIRGRRSRNTGTFEHHNPDGKTLTVPRYSSTPIFRGGASATCSEAGRTLCRAMNQAHHRLRPPSGYHRYADGFSAEFYAQKVVWGDLHDQVLSFQIKGRLQLLRRHRGHPRRRGVAWLRLDHRVAQSDLQPQPPHPHPRGIPL